MSFEKKQRYVEGTVAFCSTYWFSFIFFGLSPQMTYILFLWTNIVSTFGFDFLDSLAWNMWTALLSHVGRLAEEGKVLF